MKLPLKLLSAVVIVMLIGACSQARNKSNTKTTDQRSSNTENRTLEFTDSVTFVTASGDSVASIEVAVADEQRERSRGLMNVTNLGENEGMLFIFSREKPLSFWMANTPLSLDIIFVNANKEIVRIHHSTPPYTQQNFKSGEPALYAIETNAGFTISHDIREGMQVRF